MDLNKMNIDRPVRHLDGVGPVENNAVAPTQADFELQGLPWITEYHMLKNKRYIITNNSQGLSQLWSIDQCKLIKSYQSKKFA
jgi:hypothetical protein